MRILFLEFDGVLHPASAVVRFAPSAPLKRSVQSAWLFRWAWILDELLSAHADVGLIVHSNWRFIAPDDELRSFLGPLARRFIGTTPRAQRWQSIAQVIAVNGLRDYRILDPLPGAFPADMEELIACDPEAGLQDFKVHARLGSWLAPRSPEN
jgi:hypothetical protein